MNLKTLTMCAMALGLVSASGCREPLAPVSQPAQPVQPAQQAPAKQATSSAPKGNNEPAPAVALTVTGASKGKSDGMMPPGAQHMTEANTIYGQRCALCHGAKGHGDGVAAANLRPQPRSFAQEQWQNETSDEAIMAIIVKGGAAVGRSMMMPPARDLDGKTELLHALVAVVRNFGPGGAKAPPSVPEPVK